MKGWRRSGFGANREATGARAPRPRRARVRGPRSRGARRAHPLGCGHDVGRADRGRARTSRPLPPARLPPRRLRGKQPDRRPDQHGRPRRALPTAHGPPRDRAGAHCRPFLERHNRAPARSRRPGRGAHPGAHGGSPSLAAYRDAGGVRPRVRGAGGGAVSCGRPGRCRRYVVRGVFGSDYKGALDKGLPGAFEQAVAGADVFFGRELPAVQQWSFTQKDASRITQPALAVLGENTAPTFPERRELLLRWLPNAEPFELPDATHLLHAQNPRGMAEGMASFFARHPLPASA